MAAAASVDPRLWWDGFGALMDRIRPRFARYEPFRHAAALLQGLMSGLDRKNCWTIAEAQGARTPDGMQNLLSRASWDADGVRDDLLDYVIEAFGDPGAVLIIDETGDLKKGTHSVGVQRQYTGTAGRIENSQVAVYLTYAAPRGHAFIDRALYVPKSWTQDQARCAAAGIPPETTFATKPQLAKTMISRAVQRKTPASWVTGDEVYGADPHLRAAIRGHGLGYVLMVAATHTVPTHRGPLRAEAIAKTLPARAWQRASAGAGSKGPRYYSWARIVLLAEENPAGTAPIAGPAGGVHHLLIRRNDTTGEIAYLRTYSPRPAPLAKLIAVAGQRWRIEENFQAAKGLTGLDQHQVRRWTSWHRWTTLAMLAHAFLAVTTATERNRNAAPADMIDLSVNELRRLFDALLLGPHHTPNRILAWSNWRRRHQACARDCHYRARENP